MQDPIYVKTKKAVRQNGKSPKIDSTQGKLNSNLVLTLIGGAHATPLAGGRFADRCRKVRSRRVRVRADSRRSRGEGEGGNLRVSEESFGLSSS